MGFQMMWVEKPYAKSAVYKDGVLTVEVEGGELMPEAEIVISFSLRALPFLAQATDDQLAKVRILQEGHLLYWPEPEAEVPVISLLEKLFGLTDPNRIQRLGGLKGGLSTSEAKVQAARANGAKGGRPPKPRSAE